MRLAVLTVGCKTNFADSAAIARAGLSEGYRVVSPGEPADVVVVNSCTVTHRADRDSRAAVRRTRRENPGAVVILAGCYAAVSPGERGRLPEADHWIGGGSAGDLRGLLRELRSGDPAAAGREVDAHAAGLLLGHRRTFLKIQDGCDFRCAYCAVPRARGPGRSVPADEVVREAVRAEEAGARELVLAGIHVGRYGSDRGEREGLVRILEALLSRTRDARFRLSSLEPGEVTEPLLATIAATPRVCPHLHVPLQSGSDRTLARMRRPHTAGDFLGAVSRAAERIPNVRIGADVIAGFPGESEQEFWETEDLLSRAPVDSLHAFSYSPRPGTESHGFRDDVPAGEKKRRVATLRELDRRMRTAFLARQVGRTLTVLAERPAGGRGRLRGTSENYADVTFPGGEEELGRLVPVRVAEVFGDGLVGRRDVPG